MDRLRGCAAAVALTAVLLPAADSYRASLDQWRRERDSSLLADGGWLSVTGLFWLKEGENRAGSDPTADIVLPPPAPAKAGVFIFHNGVTQFRLTGGSTRALKPDTAGGPDPVMIGNLRLHVIERGGRYGLRLVDPNSQYRREFKGTHWFPVNESWRVSAKFIPHSQPRTVSIPTIIGGKEEMKSPGVVVFSHGGRKLRLEPVIDGQELWFIFRDATSGKKTYGGGRFLYAGMPRDGKVEIDFNRAYNPPCAFTPYATCPLPPKQNSLPVPVDAGELAYGH